MSIFLLLCGPKSCTKRQYLYTGRVTHKIYLNDFRSWIASENFFFYKKKSLGIWYFQPIFGQLLDLISPAKFNISEPSFKSYEPWDMANCILWYNIGCPIIIWTGPNIKIGIVQKVYEWWSCSFAKMIVQSGDHFGKRTAPSLIYFLNYAYFDILPSPVNYGTPSTSRLKVRISSL